MPERPLNYPDSLKVSQVDTYHEISVEDPYRWLEDPDSPQTQAWIEAQNQLTFSYLEEIPQRIQLRQRLSEIWNYERFSVPFKRGDWPPATGKANRYFFFKNDGLQNQSVLYVLEDLEGTPTVLLDPNLLSEDGTVALSGLAVSEDGEWLAYGLSTGGSDWQDWYVRSVATGEDLSDRLQWVKFSGAVWTKDNRGFFYSRYDEPTKNEDVNYFQKLYYHRRGTPQSDDVLIYHRPDQKEWLFDAEVSEDGSYLIISVRRGTDPKNLVFLKNLDDPDAEIVPLIDEFEASYSFIYALGSRFWFLTDLEASRRRVIAIAPPTRLEVTSRRHAAVHSALRELTEPIELNSGEASDWQDVIPEGTDTLESVSLLNNQFVAAYLQDARSSIRLFDLDGAFIRELELPGIGSVGGFNGKREDTETFYAFTSFTTPTTIYRYDFINQESTIFRQPEVDFNPQRYETRQVFYRSQDGTPIPMFVTHKKGLLLDGNNPTLLYAYGGFGVSLTPSFSVSRLLWMELGGVYAVPNLRGGGEYGEAWHQAGTKLDKQNVFDDFIAAARWLCDNGYTHSGKLAIAGGSNGGLLVGACITQQPDLFGAALPAVGVFDMLRFPKFTIGWAWCSDYGSPDNPEEFQALYAYSPLHNLKPGTAYPATLLTTADRDDRVVPAHSFKFTAALQAAQGGDSPILIRIETKAGHGAGKPTSKRIEEIADQWAFLMEVLGMDV